MGLPFRLQRISKHNLNAILRAAIRNNSECVSFLVPDRLNPSLNGYGCVWKVGNGQNLADGGWQTIR
jgi:hypothetical protein